MRRIMAFVTFLLLVFSSAALAEEIDFSNMDLEQLASIRMAADEEIAKRYGEGWEILNTGNYLIGEFFRSGFYEILAIKLDKYMTYQPCTLYTTKEKKLTPEDILVAELLHPGGRVFISAEDGNLLEVRFGTFLIREVPKSKYAP